jgi:hypothetical protein
MPDEFDQYKSTPAAGGDEFEQYKAKPASATVALSTGQKVLETGKAMGSAAISAVTGAAKGAGHTLLNLSDMQSVILGGPIIDRIFPEQSKAKKATRETIDKALEPGEKEKATYLAEQFAEFFIPIGGGEVKAAATAPRWIKMLVGAGRDALDIGLKTFVQTKDPEAALKAAGVAGSVGAGARVAGEVLPKAGKAAYEAALRPAVNVSLANREGMVERGLKELHLPVQAASLDKIEPEIERNKDLIASLTKDPGSPYSARTIPIDTALNPVDKWIKRVARVDKTAANSLQAARDRWAESLGYKAPTPASQTSTGLLNASGQPIMKTVPATRGVTDVSVADMQRLKEDLYKIIHDPAYAAGAEPAPMVAGRKLAARGLKRGIENTIPEAPIKAINDTMSTDIRLKKAIDSALRRRPSWINDWALFVLGSAGGEILAGHLGGGVAAIGALTRMAARNPVIMSRLAIALERSGEISKASELTQAVGGVMAATRDEVLDEDQPSPKNTLEAPRR